MSSRNRYSPIVIANGKYKLQKLIASGSFGRVYNCFPYAIKEIKLPSLQDAHVNFYMHVKETLDNEINVMRDVNHENVVKLFEIIHQNDCVYLVMEYCQSDLKAKSINQSLGQKKAIQIMQQILKGCRQMVKLNIVHRDIKPANILYNKGTYKLADFGMAKYLQSSQGDMLKSHVGTPYYMAPQILQRKSYSKKCDIWSLGIIFYQLIFGRLPWDGKDEKALLANVLSRKLTFPNTISPQVKDTLIRMLSVSQQRRLNWQQVFTVFELLSSKYQSENNKKENNEQVITIHRSVIEQMINIEIERISMMQYKKNYSSLSNEEAIFVNKMFESIFREDYLYVVRDFLDEKQMKRY